MELSPVYSDPFRSVEKIRRGRTLLWRMRIVWLTLMFLAASLVLPTLTLAESRGFEAQYVGGTVISLGDKAAGTMRMSDENLFIFRVKKTEVKVSYAKVNLLEYGQKVDRRYAMALLVSPMFLLSKKRQHFLTVGYEDEAGRQQALVFKVGKSDVRAVLVSLEARTGLKVQFQDGEARKAGKG